MNLDLFDRRRAERFAQLLDETNGGPRHHGRDQADGQLADLVTIGHTLSAVRPAVQVDPEFRTGLRAMLVATAERDGIGVQPTETAPAGHAAIREPRRGLLTGGAGRRIRARGAIVLGVAAGALAVSGISAASENAVPGDALYGVKRSTERAQLAMAGSDVTRGQLSLDFARTRLAEAAALDGADPDFPTVLDDMDDDTRKGVRLLTASAVAREDTSPLAAIETFVSGQRRIITPLLDRLAAANSERAMTSTTLLDQIVRRAEGLRSAIACDSEATSGVDSLGPRPRACWVGSDSSTTDSPRAGQGEQAGEPGSATTTSRTPKGTKPTGDTTAPGADEPSKRRPNGTTADDPTSDDPTSDGATRGGATSGGSTSDGSDSDGSTSGGSTSGDTPTNGTGTGDKSGDKAAPVGVSPTRTSAPQQTAPADQPPGPAQVEPDPAPQEDDRSIFDRLGDLLGGDDD